MKSLFIDTSSKNLIIAVLDNGHLLSIFNETLASDMSSKALPIIQQLLDQNALVPNDIDVIYVVNGPGSFTGIRVGLAIAKVYAFAVKKKLVPISSLEVLASSVEGLTAPIIDARHECIYGAVYDEDLNLVEEEKYMNQKTFLDICQKYDVTFVSNDNFDSIKTVYPQVNIEKIVKKHQFDSGINPHSLVPNYLKLTEAEEKLRSKHD